MKSILPWSAKFLWDQLPYMTLPSAMRYRRMIIREKHCGLDGSKVLQVRLRNPFSGDVWIRYGTSDMRTFDEVVIQQVYRDVCDAVPGCQYVIDLGGNIGLAARYFAARYPAARIMSVEPDLRNQAVFCRNMAAIPAGRWGLMKAAAWRVDEPVTLSSIDDTTGCGLEYDSLRVQRPAAHDTTTVRGLTLKSIISESGFPSVDLLKIDIEGAETDIFADGAEWLSVVRAIAIEFHGDSRKESGFDMVVADHHFTVHEANDHTVLAIRQPD